MRISFTTLTLLSTILLTPNATAASEDVTLSLDRSGTVSVPVTIDGRGPFTFLLDTGSSHSVVSSEVAYRLALRAVAKTAVLTSAGSELRPVIKLIRTSIGTAMVQELLASVVAAAQLKETLPGIDGIIGQDFLSAFNYTLDYERKRLTWKVEPSEHGPDIRVALVHQEGRLLAQLIGAVLGRALLLVPDSGAEQFVIYERAGRTPLMLEPADGSFNVLGLAGRRQARAATLHVLQIGEARFTHQPVVVLDRTGIDAREGDGLLPLHLFASVSFNTREGYMVVRTK